MSPKRGQKSPCLGQRVALALLCAILCPLSPVLAKAPQGMAPFHAGNVTFPLGRAELCRDQGLCWIPTASLPGDFAGTETWAATCLTDGSGGCSCLCCLYEPEIPREDFAANPNAHRILGGLRAVGAPWAPCEGPSGGCLWGLAVSWCREEGG